MQEQTPQPEAGQTPSQTYVDPATNLLYTINPTTGQSEWVIDPATGQPMAAATTAEGVQTPATPPSSASVLDASIAGQNTQTTPFTQPQTAGASSVATQALPNSGLAVAALVLGILAFLISFLPLANFGSIVMGLLGAVLGAVGLVGIRKGTHRGKGLAIAGIVLSILALLVTFLMYGSAAAYVSENSAANSTSAQQTTSGTQEATQDTSAAGTASTPTEDTSAEDASTESTPAEDASEQADAAASEYAVSIDSARLGVDYEGKEVVIVSYTWTNNSDRATSFAATLYPKVFQNNVEINTAIVVDDLNSEGYMADVKPGGTVSFEMAYKIADHSDVTVEVTELISFDDTILAEQVFTLE